MMEGTGTTEGSGHHKSRHHSSALALQTHSFSLNHDATIPSHMSSMPPPSQALEAHSPKVLSMSRKARSERKQNHRNGRLTMRTALLTLLAAPTVMAETCISLAGSTQCPAFSAASISTNSDLVGFFPFLQYVSSQETFDEQLGSYISTAYPQQKYETLLGCQNVNLTNTTNLYARFTTTVICNSIIQNSKTPCGLDDTTAPPVCADTCAQQAESEETIVGNSDLCSNPGSNAETQIRADFTNCALPDTALSGNCIEGALNEPDNCGFGNSTLGLCQYCGAGGQNNTDTCCYNSGAQGRCSGLVLPKITAIETFTQSLPTSTGTSASSSSSATSSSASAHTSSAASSGLSHGAITGIAVGVVVGLLLLAGLIVGLCLCMKRRRGSQQGSIFNQPTPARGDAKGMTYNQAGNANTTPEGYEVLPGGRIARMSALEGHSGSQTGSAVATASGAAAGSAAGYAAGRRRHHDQSSSDGFSDSPSAGNHGGVHRAPMTGRRQGSLSSGSALGFEDSQTPRTGSVGELSPHGMTSQQSEQLASFKDYYSQDEIHPGDKVATLWAYQPRAGDEFGLERGDMLKVIGIWDDGWATGVMISERADEWDEKRSKQRDSGVSNTSMSRDDVAPATGDIKAFPLVCVCLPEHWRRTIDGDGSTETGSTNPTQNGS